MLRSLSFIFCLAFQSAFSLSTTAAFQASAKDEATPKVAPDTEKKETSDLWISLFNGKDLEGWSPKIVGQKYGDNYANTFRVEDELLTVSYKDYKEEDFKPSFSKFGHLFYKEKFSHYILRIEYRFIGDQCPNGPGWAWRNSGAMLHGQDPETMELDQPFPVSVEAQFLGGDGKNPRTTLNLCTPGTNVVKNGKLFTPHCTNSNSATFHGDEWVTVEIEVRGNEVLRHRVNDKVVLEYNQPQYDPKDKDAKKIIPADGNLMLSEGTISLQSESHPIQFRKIEINDLSDKR